MKFILFFILAFSLNAQELNLIAVGDANVEKVGVGFGHDKSNNMNGIKGKLRDDFLKLLNNDFAFYRQYFSVVQSKALNLFPEGSPNFNYLINEKIRYFGQISFDHKDEMKFTMRFYNASSKEKILEESGSYNIRNLRKVGHSLADKVYRKLTGKESIFKSQIVFVSDSNTKGKDPIKELFIMDFDGGNKKQLTRHGGIVMSPAISPDRNMVLYTLIKQKRGKKRNVDLYVLDRRTNKVRLVSNRKGINSGAIFHPNGKDILLTLSHQGNAEIYQMNLATKKIRRITKNFAPDVDPSLNNRGDLLAFLSGRPGAAHIYLADPRGQEQKVTRISFVGKFNATPRFSPDGKEIAFSSWLDNRFDIFRIDSEGNNLVRLTKDFGSNEDPTFSNDGEFIAFSSQRVLSRTKAVHNVYIMTKDGEIIGSVTNGYGNCITPRWTK